MSIKTLIVKHTVLDPTPFHQDPWGTYGHIYCEGAGGERILLLYLRPDTALANWPSWPASHNSYNSASKIGVAFFRAWEFAWHTALFASGKAAQIEVDDVYPGGIRIFTDVTIPAPSQDPVPDVIAWIKQHMNVYYALKWNEPNRGGLMLDDWPTPKKQDFVEAFAAAWNHQPSLLPWTLDDPPPNLANFDTDGVVLSAENAWRLFCAHAAYSLAVEIGKRVPWSITGYSASDLELLLHGGRMFGWDPTLNGYGLQIKAVPAPPEFTWAFLYGNGLIGADRVSTIAKVLDWCRNSLTHFWDSATSANMVAHWDYAGYPPVSRVVQGTVCTTYPQFGVRHYTAGCGGTTAFLQAVLRTVNIPVENLSADGDRTPHFTTDDLYLSHGDDPYRVPCTPQFDARLLLIDKTTYNNWFGSSVPDSIAENNVGRRAAELEVQYLTDYLLNMYYQDQQNGRTPQTGDVYTKYLQRYYPNFTDLYPDLWQRMDQKLAAFGAVAWPPCEFYDFDLLVLARSQIGMTLEQTSNPDPNNDFLSATIISLQVPDTSYKRLKIQKDEKELQNLNMPDTNDKYYFSIEYTCSKFDDAYRETGLPQEISRYLGLWVTNYPAALYFSEHNAKNYCMDMEIYRCDELNRKLYESLPKTSHECIYNPTYVLGARKCYLALKNADYSSQGAFFYDLVIGYYSAHDWLSVDTNAPAYRAQTTIQRKILKELYERIDLPRPPEDFQRSGQRVQPGESVVWGTAIHVGTFVKEYEKFLEVSEVAAMLGQIAHKASRTVVAEEYGNLAKAAQAYKLFDDAERIYLKSAGAYSKLEDKKLEVGVLDNLANMYTEQGKKNAAKKILNRIKKIVG